MNGHTTTFDAYHIMPKTHSGTKQATKRKIPRIDFDAPREKREPVLIDNIKVEQYRRASRHDQHMEYLLSSLFAIISIVGVVSFLITF